VSSGPNPAQRPARDVIPLAPADLGVCVLAAVVLIAVVEADTSRRRRTRGLSTNLVSDEATCTTDRWSHGAVSL